MPNLEILKPYDAAVGNRRLLDELKSALDSADFDDFRLIVAYAKAGPLHRLKTKLEKWKADGKTLKAIFGIDQQGKSKSSRSKSSAERVAKDIRREAGDLKECVAGLTLENRLLKKSMIADGGGDE